MLMDSGEGDKKEESNGAADLNPVQYRRGIALSEMTGAFMHAAAATGVLLIQPVQGWMILAAIGSAAAFESVRMLRESFMDSAEAAPIGEEARALKEMAETILGNAGVGRQVDMRIVDRPDESAPRNETYAGMVDRVYGHYSARVIPRANSAGLDRLEIGRGMLDMLTPEETRAVINHELGHVICPPPAHGVADRMGYAQMGLSAAAALVAGPLPAVVGATAMAAARICSIRAERIDEMRADHIGAILHDNTEDLCTALEKIRDAVEARITGESPLRGILRRIRHPSIERRIEQCRNALTPAA